MYKLLVVKHADITDDLLKDVVNVKTVAWPYPYEEHVRWMNENIENEDLHLLLKKGSKAVAYLNLIAIDLIIDGFSWKGYGVGNVSTKYRNMGYGKELIWQANQFIRAENRIGLLFCKKDLVPFYKRYAWTIVPNQKKGVKSFESNWMIFNYKKEFMIVSYDGRFF